MGEFGVPHKEAKKNSSVNKGQSLEAFPNSSKEMMTTMMMMMVHQNHHQHRSLSPFDDDSCAVAGDGDGTRSYVSLCNNNNNSHINDVASASVSAAAIHSGGASAAVRNLQPFDISTSNSTPVTTTTLPAFKSPVGMAGFPFTNAQWKELERQAMIYKYMMASVPVPPALLIPISLQASSRSPLETGFNLRLSSSTDPEPGRCRRTDGKKWRCSRDVAPNHKYCERHMHRGRPRSRKPVEVHADSNISSDNNNQQPKKPRHDSHPFHASDVTVAIPNPTIRKNGPSSQPCHESSFTFDKFGVKAANFESLASVSSTKEPRGLDWMLKGDPISFAASNPEWQSLMQNRVGFNTQSYLNYQEHMYPNSYSVFHSELDQQNRRSPPFLNPLLVPMENPQSQKPRGFIDAWSNAETDEKYANPNKSSVASNNKLSLSSLDLSMGGGGGSSVDEEIGNIQMGLGLMEPDGDTEAGGTKTHFTNWLTPAAPWVASTTPGGPLAEVLRPSTVAAANEAASNSSSPVITNAESSSPLATMVSSSGVLQKTLASLSDSSNSSSPTRANSEIAIMWFNQSKLATST